MEGQLCKVLSLHIVLLLCAYIGIMHGTLDSKIASLVKFDFIVNQMMVMYRCTDDDGHRA